MPVTFDPGAEPGLIRLEGEIDISQADALKRVLLAALQEKGGVERGCKVCRATGLWKLLPFQPV